LSTGQQPGFRLSYLLDGEPHSVEFRKPEVLIGRSWDCDLVLCLPRLSRKHALIQRTGDGWMVFDQRSRNGTFVNGQRITHQRLNHGDQIELGWTAEAPLALSFELLTPAAADEGRVEFDDHFHSANFSLTINVEEYERRQAATAAALGAAAPPPAGQRAPISIINLFQQVGEALLTSKDLDELLDKVMDLALENLPARRGFICLCDPAGETITPKTARTKGLAVGQSIAISRSIARAAIQARQALLVTDAPSDARFARAESVQQMAIRAAMCAPLYHAGQVQGLIYVDSDGSEKPFSAHDLELLTALGGLTAVGIQQARLRDDAQRERAIRTRLTRYSSPAVVDQIVARLATRDGEMVSQQHEVSVLFGDLCGFTALAEGMEPAEVAQLLNGAFAELTRAVFLYDGILDKYAGDALMAVFGAPLPQADHAERAVRAALAMQRSLEDYNRTRPQGPPLRMRIGINSGTAVAGDIGSPVRKDYTVIVDAVNVASRLESSVAEADQVVIGPATYALVEGKFACQPLAEVRLKGKQQILRPYLVLGPQGEA